MVEPNSPGPGRSTSETAIKELKKETARRNEEAQKAGRKRRAAREKEHLANLRKWIRSEPASTAAAVPKEVAVRHDGCSRASPSKTGRSRSAPSAVSLTAAFPEIARAVPPEDRQDAERTLIAPVLAARDEDLANVFATVNQDVFDFLNIDGVVLKETSLAHRSAFELLGAGDFLAPPLSALRQVESRACSHYLAHGPVSLAVIDGRFRQAAGRWPGLFDILHDRLGQQTHRASMHLAMLHLPRIEDRITLLFADLAERFGRMTADGIVIDLSLTHAVIGGLVGSRRPSVSLALHTLASEGLLIRLSPDRWKVAPTAVNQ